MIIIFIIKKNTDIRLKICQKSKKKKSLALKYIESYNSHYKKKTCLQNALISTLSNFLFYTIPFQPFS